MPTDFDDDFFKDWLLEDFIRQTEPAAPGGPSAELQAERARERERARQRRDDAWQKVWTRVHRGLCARLGRDRADDATADVVMKLHRAFTSGAAEPIAFEKYVDVAVRHAAIDIHRRAQRAAARLVPLEGTTESADDGHRLAPIDVLAHPAMNPEQERARVETQRQQVVLMRRRVARTVTRWLAWLRIMRRLSREAKSATLVAMVDEIRTYLHSLPPPSGRGEGPDSVFDIAALALRLSLEDVNEFLLSKGTGRTALDQRWKRIRRVAKAAGVLPPPGLDLRGASA